MRNNLPLQHIFLLLLILLIGSSCKKQNYQIIGTVDNELFWGRQVYLVALDAPITKNVDSTTIENGRFQFRGKADSLEVRVLRVQPQIPDYIEDLVVILESGTIRAHLSTKSYGEGTPLNNLLQNWKDSKAAYDSIYSTLTHQLKQKDIHQIEKDSINNLREQIGDAFLSNNIKILKRNAHNGIGLLLFKLYYHRIPAEDKNEIISKVGNLYFERDQQLRNQIQQ